MSHSPSAAPIIKSAFSRNVTRTVFAANAKGTVTTFFAKTQRNQRLEQSRKANIGISQITIFNEMNFISEFIKRSKWGYPIGRGFRLSSKSRDNYMLSIGGKSFDVFAERLANNDLIIFTNQKAEKYSNFPDQDVPIEIWETGVHQLAENFRKKGVKIIYSSI